MDGSDQRPDIPPEGNAGNPTIRITAQEELGSTIGRFRLLEKIGEGGFGVVYVAEQREPVKRRVALKIIKLGMDTQQVVARFEAERQALAVMDHPHIAKVFDAGATDTGRPYFVMELVRGAKITSFCDQNRLTIPQRLELFLLVCQAIQHAHQKGIIHRDIKPSNILVSSQEGTGVPKVIDFGIAKATQQDLSDKTVYTQMQQFIGTPAYVSPEQAQGGLDIDTRSDIYSLGVLLYELLTGYRPFDANALMDQGIDVLRRTIQEKEPPRPSTKLSSLDREQLAAVAGQRSADALKLISALRGDLNWVVMKCLEKDRVRRYETANALALDIKRFLKNEPVEARPPDTFYRFSKLVRRNKMAFAAASLTVLGLMLVTALSLRLWIQEKRLRRQAEAVAAVDRANAALSTELRERAEISDIVGAAAVLLTQGKLGQADEKINTLPPTFRKYAPSNYVGAAVIFRVLGDWEARQEKWPMALKNYSNVVITLPADPAGYCSFALLQFQTGGRDQYLQARKEMLARFSTVSDPSLAGQIARTCLISPVPDDSGNVQRLIDAAAASRPPNAPGDDLQFLKGLAEYRRGHFAEAIQQLQKLAANGGQDIRSLQAGVIMAMAEQALGQTGAARESLAGVLPRLERGPILNADWRDWVITSALVQEARSLIP